MREEVLNLQLRKFLKSVGVASQREIEKAVRDAFTEGTIDGTETLEANMTLEIPQVGLKHTIVGKIALTD